MALLTTDEVKTYLRIDLADTAEDALLDGLITAAGRACEQRTGRFIDPADATAAGSLSAPFTSAELELVKIAALKLIGELYANRETSVTGAAIAELPVGIRWLLDPLRDFSDR